MNCPKCQHKFRVLNTSSADSGSRKFIRTSLNPILDWFTDEFVARQRVCDSCGNSAITLEIDRKDFLQIIREVLKEVPDELQPYLDDPKKITKKVKP